jgi:hypothetical protein
MGHKTATVNGRTYAFDEASPPTIQELEEQGAVTQGQLVVRDLGKGRKETLSKKDRLEPESVINSVPRYVWGC